jgi:mannitol/fructose-specific phosphotransferase system IIA component (Ntr-type)
MPITLANFTSPSLILLDLRGDGAASAIKELSRALHVDHRVPDVLPFYQAALNREFMASTNLEAGMAFPHARVPGLKEVSFALGRSDEPLRWAPQAAGSVRLIFLTAVPATDATQYLLLSSGFARLSRDLGLVARLQAAPDTFQMLEVLQQVGLRTNPANQGLKKREPHP